MYPLGLGLGWEKARCVLFSACQISACPASKLHVHQSIQEHQKAKEKEIPTLHCLAISGELHQSWGGNLQAPAATTTVAISRKDFIFGFICPASYQLYLIICKEEVHNSWVTLNTILVHKYYLNQSNWFISSEWSQNLLIKVSLIKVCRGESSVRGQLFCWHQHWGSVHIMIITWKWDLDQMSMVHHCITYWKIQMW